MKCEDKIIMNILIIGNGFDLAHGLPTKYGDFLKYAQAYEKYKDICRQESVKEEWEKADEIGKEYILHFSNLFDQNRKYYDELGELIQENIWLSYFTDVFENRSILGKDGWIDFESEIAEIIQAMDRAKKTILEQINRGEKTGKMTQSQLNILSPIFGLGKNINCKSVSFEEKSIQYRKDQFLNDLNRLIRCLEIYLCCFVETNDRYKKINTLQDIEEMPIIDKVLSFNYTHTYKKIYEMNSGLVCDYIHGEAKLENSIETNNMVLGIDEYLDEEHKNTEIEYIEFKKFFQRIHKETGCLYREWIDEIKSNAAIKETIAVENRADGYIRQTQGVNFHKVFIYGHSLDVTDKDILKDFILNDNVQTTVFYLDKNDYGKKIINLVRIIGQDELIKRTGGKTKTITFKKISG